MDPRATRWTVGLIAWTAFVWGNRVRNALAADEGAGALVLPAVLAVATLAAVWGVARGRRGPLGAADLGALRLLPALTVPIWLVRGTDIALSGHEAAFVLVHLVLAAISVALAVQTWRALPPPTWSSAAPAQ